ncbi:ImmA/IrrE family metallo-endopeptidase [Nioella nitratireducens]|uniref:ImmA/IrrE family metallo-endopeptidase n=1 Tax=Nioella nitratireducens TaxID=1287720 RepID=UPI001F21E422|nr:ImmA/IrrE family metallo-endopeptidase [Nioella nitratireducens]
MTLRTKIDLMQRSSGRFSGRRWAKPEMRRTSEMASIEFRHLSKNVRDLIAPFLSQKPVPLGALARSLGLRVKVAPLDRGVSGSIRKAEDGVYEIRVNKFETRSRQRFTIAHEISHFLLHKSIIDEQDGIKDNILLRSGLPQKIEYEANRLAADLIMPDDFIERDARRYFSDGAITEEVVEQLSDEWGVSKAAMEIKLGNFVAG